MSKLRNPFAIGWDALLTSLELFAVENRAGISVVEAVEVEELNVQFGMFGMRADERRDAREIALLFAQAGMKRDDVADLLHQWMNNMHTSFSDSSTTKENN